MIVYHLDKSLSAQLAELGLKPDDIGGHTPGHQSLLVHLQHSGFIILSGDVAHLRDNFERNTVPSLNTSKTESTASMERIRRLIAAYQAKFFINHDKSQTGELKLLPAFYD